MANQADTSDPERRSGEPSEAEEKAFEEKKAHPDDPNAGEDLSTDAKHAAVLENEPDAKWESKIAGKLAEKFSKRKSGDKSDGDEKSS